jgi:hypothetical protein
MLTIVWNPGGFDLIKVLDKGRKFNSGHYIAEILKPLSQRRSIKARGNERGVLMCARSPDRRLTLLSTATSLSGRHLVEKTGPLISGGIQIFSKQ